MSLKHFDTVTHEFTFVKPSGVPNLLTKSIRRSGLPDEVSYIMSPPEPARAKTANVRVYRNMVKVTENGKQPPHLKGARRGLVSMEFTGKPRKRCLDALNQWQIPNINLVFCHLTYPAEYPLDWRIWKLDLKRFKQALLRKWPNAQGVWKLELQRRGAPHFHIILDTGKPVAIKRMRQWIDACWARIAHQNDQYQGKYACRVETCWSIRHAMNYAGKYLTKPGFNPVDDDGVILEPADLNATMGRLWGKIGKLNCDPVAEFSVIRETIDYYRMQCALEIKKRGARGWYGLAHPRMLGSFGVYGLGAKSDDRFPTAQAMFEVWELELWQIGNMLDWYFTTLRTVNNMQCGK